MIKGNLFGKLLKQLFSILLISCFILLGSSFVSAGQIFITNGEYTTNDNLHYDFTFQNGNNFLTNGEYRVFSVYSNQYYPSSYPRFYNVFWTDNGLYVIETCEGGYECSNIHTAIKSQGYFTNYCETGYSFNCIDSNIPIQAFIGNDNYKYPSSFTLHDAGQSLNFCFDYEDLNKSICFNGGLWSSLNNSLGFNYNPFPSELGTSADTISNYLKTSPRGLPSSGGGDFVDIDNGGIELDSNHSAINYFESNYGWDSSICYVGVDSLDYLWGSSVSFQQGSGLSIFQAFSGLYGNTDLNKVYVWLNSRLINYEQWFTRDEPLYLSTYNSGTNQVDLYYDNLTFPFAGKPVAFYFMSDYIYGKSPYRSMGSEVVSYCNIKINDGDYNEILDDSTKNNINIYTQQHNKSKGLNYDGSKKVFKNGFVVDYSSGSIGSYTGYTWEDFQHSGNVNPTNFFEFATSEMKSAMNNMQNPLTGVLPSYIIYGLLFFAFFKLLRK